MEHLDHQDDLILQIVKRLEEQHLEMREQIARLDPTLAQRLGTDIVDKSSLPLYIGMKVYEERHCRGKEAGAEIDRRVMFCPE
jgi:hypothetical protein